MTIFSIVIVCAHVASCTLPAPVYSHFEAESLAMCEQNVRWIAAREGLRDFIVTCSERGA